MYIYINYIYNISILYIDIYGRQPQPTRTFLTQNVSSTFKTLKTPLVIKHLRAFFYKNCTKKLFILRCLSVLKT